MRKNFTLFFLFLFTCLSSLWAGPVTEDNARRTAEDFFRSLSPSMMRGTVTMRLVYQPTLARSSGGEAEYYVFAPDTLGGFVVVSGDDTLTPIVGYSVTEAASGTRIPDALKAWLDDYARYVRDVRIGSAKAYMRDISKLRAAGKAIEPMVVTKWDQGEPYNDQCPVIGNGKTPTGCVATAMAQIMKFHGWPDVGEGSKTYYDNQGEVTLDLSKSVYDWAHMRDEYNYSWGEDGTIQPEYTEKEAAAVSKLMLECGRTVNMEYSLVGSGAVSQCVVSALVDYYKYSPQTRFYYRSVYTTDEWVKLIRQNLELRQPMLYSGNGAGGGHAFVCDGIDARDYVHINWGWSGNYNGYFDMSYLVPAGTGIGGGSGTYFENQGVVAGIRPRVEGETAVPGNDLVLYDMRIIGETSYPLQDGGGFSFDGFMSKLYNISGRQLNGEAGFCIKRDGVWNSSGRIMRVDVSSDIYYINVRLPITVSTSPALGGDYITSGSYEIAFCYKQAGQEEWIPVDGGSGANGMILELTDSEIRIRLNKEVEPAQISLVSVISSIGDLYTNTSCDITLLLRNSGSALPNTNIFYAVIPEGKGENLTDQEIQKYIKGYSIPYVYGNTEMEVYFKCAVAEAGRYRVRLYSQDPVTSVYVPLSEDSPNYLSFIPLPDNPIPLLTEPLNVLSEIEQGTDTWVSYVAKMKGVGSIVSWYTGKLALYAAKKGDTSGKEYKLLEQYVRVTDNDEYLEDTYGSTTTTVFMEPGEYEAYLKYDAGGGEMVKVTPEAYNTSSFVLKASSIPLVYVSAPVVVNGGDGVVQGSYGEIEVTVISNTDYTGQFNLFAGAYNGAGEYISWVLNSSNTATATLKAGVPTILRLPYHCNPEAVLGNHKVEFTYNVGENSYPLALGEYQSTCSFMVVEALVHEGLRLNSPLVVNGGNDVVRGSRGLMRFSLISGEDFTGEFYPISLSDAGYVMSGTSKRVTLQANVPQEVTLEYECAVDAELGQQKVTIYYLLDGVTGSNALDYGGYESSAYFNVAISTGVEDTPLSGCVLITRPDAFLLKGVVPGSSVHVTALDGRILFEGTAAGVEMSLPMSGVSSGLYIVTVKTPDGEMKALKGRRR